MSTRTGRAEAPVNWSRNLPVVFTLLIPVGILLAQTPGLQGWAPALWGLSVLAICAALITAVRGWRAARSSAAIHEL